MHYSREAQRLENFYIMKTIYAATDFFRLNMLSLCFFGFSSFACTFATGIGPRLTTAGVGASTVIDVRRDEEIFGSEDVLGRADEDGIVYCCARVLETGMAISRSLDEEIVLLPEELTRE